jgi:hypothetical protein
MKPLEQNVCVTTPIGDDVTCSKYVEDCPIIIGSKTLPAKLAVFEMLGFDVILGMDWLSKYGASIDCRAKEVIFRPLDAEEFKFCGLVYELLRRFSPQFKQGSVSKMVLKLIWLMLQPSLRLKQS